MSRLHLVACTALLIRHIAVAMAMSTGADIVNQPSDFKFRHDWSALSIPEREALPDDVRALGYARYSALTDGHKVNGASVLPQPLPGFTAGEIWSGYSPPSYLVKGILGIGEVTGLIGQSGTFKSVLAIDLALCVG